jgi:hypothetical protein
MIDQCLERSPLVADKDELIELRGRVDCRSVLEAAGWELDVRESTRKAAKYRQGAGRIVIVTHEGKGWFDPLNDRRGDVLALAQHVWGGNLGHARKALRPLAGIAPKLLPMRQGGDAMAFEGDVLWSQAIRLRLGSPGWNYLTDKRHLPVESVTRALQFEALREGIHGTVWAMHQGAAGSVTGWEMRGPNYKGFSKGGTKTLFWLGHPTVADRLAVTESAIDALSLASLEGWPDGTLYASTGGGYGPETGEALRGLLPRHGELVAATDQGTGGELLAGRLHELATERRAGFSRLQPQAKDWNEQLAG